jgi:hypothetical protein
LSESLDKQPKRSPTRFDQHEARLEAELQRLVRLFSRPRWTTRNLADLADQPDGECATRWP